MDIVTLDGAAMDSASALTDAELFDAAGPDASSADADAPDADAGVSDAATALDANGLDAANDAASDAAAMDAAAGDGSVTDSGSSDGAVDAGDGSAGDGAAADSGVSPLCPERAGVLFCDGFEDPDFARWSYPVVSNGTLARSTTRVHSGTTALRATTGAAGTGNAARYATKVLAGQTSGEIWVRYYYYLPSSTVVNSSFSAGVASDISPPYDGFFLVVRATRVDIGGMGGPYTGTMAFPRDKWTCVELHTKVDASQGYFEAYLDTTLAVRSTLTNTVPAGGYVTAEVGIHYASDGSQGPVEVYVDDVMVANTRIACD